MKHVCKRDLIQKTTKVLSNDPTIVTNHGNPQYFVGKIDTVEGYKEAINSLRDFGTSLGLNDNVSGAYNPTMTFSASSINNSIPQETKDALISETTQQPFVTRGGEIKYKKHSHR